MMNINYFLTVGVQKEVVNRVPFDQVLNAWRFVLLLEGVQNQDFGNKAQVELSGRKEYNKDDLFRFERLKVDDNNSHGHGGFQHFLVSKVLSTPCRPLPVSYDSLGKEPRQLLPVFADEVNENQTV